MVLVLVCLSNQVVISYKENLYSQCLVSYFYNIVVEFGRERMREKAQQTDYINCTYPFTKWDGYLRHIGLSDLGSTSSLGSFLF